MRVINKMPEEELIRIERQVNDQLLNRYGWPLTKDIIQKELSIVVQNVHLDESIEARLIEDADANGRIQINSIYADDQHFDYLHEVMHYVMDVGIGKKVDRSFTRLRTGNSNDPHEREIDVAAAIAMIPSNILFERIMYYRKNWYKIDELKYMRDMQEEFKCSQACLEKRISEVHRLRKKKLLPL